MDLQTPRANFCHKMIVKKEFQLKIPTLSKNDCSATWCPNCYRKKSTCGNLRNRHRYEKHVVIFRPTLLTVADLFKLTVDSSLLMKQNANFQADITQVLSAVIHIPLQSCGFKTISKNFQLRYHTIFYLKGHQNG